MNRLIEQLTTQITDLRQTLGAHFFRKSFNIPRAGSKSCQLVGLLFSMIDGFR